MHFTKQGIVLAALAVTLPAVSPAASAADVLTAAVFGSTGSSSNTSNTRSRSLGTSTNPTPASAGLAPVPAWQSILPICRPVQLWAPMVQSCR